MIYIFRPQASASARLLTEHIQEQGVQARRRRALRPNYAGNLIVFWGAEDGGYQGLNNSPMLSKLSELAKLKSKGVVVPEYFAEFHGNFLGDPPDQGVGWYPRTGNHSGGLDLLAYDTGGELDSPPAYWVKKEELARELRIHIWGGRSIRVGLKVPGDEQAHPWIRSRAGGWRLSYGADAQDVVRQRHRMAAASAVAALGLHFGAVDVGIRVNGTPVVLEVNRAPGLDNATARRYAAKVIELANSNATLLATHAP